MVSIKKISYLLLVLVIAGVSFFAGGLFKAGQEEPAGLQAEREILYYIDPMTPGFRSDEPGIAPCGMPLEPVYADSPLGEDGFAGTLEALPAGAVKLSSARRQLAGVKVRPVQMEPMKHTLRLYGKLVADETRTFRINASTDSWVRKLPDITTGDIVKKNQILAEVLAPAFYNAQVTYLVALDNVDRIMQQLGGQLRHQQADLADNTIRVAVQTLQNLGITDAQIEELANERQAQPFLQVRSPANGVVLDRELTLYQWFKAGEQFYTIADIGHLWVYADVYEDEVLQLRPGMEVRVKHLQTRESFEARVSKVLPLFDGIAKTLKVRIDIDNADYELRPDMFVDIEIPITQPPSLHLPADAIIDSGERKIVFVDKGGGVIEPRRITTGWRLGRQVEVTAGLMAGENVVVEGNFLIDSESRMKTALSESEKSVAGRATPAIDPVCGMLVDKARAEISGRSSVHEGNTVYFCSDTCKHSFAEDPGKYGNGGKVAKVHHQHGADHGKMGGKRESWLAMLKVFSGSEEMEETTHYPGIDRKDSPINLVDPGVIDWSGVDKYGNKIPPREWRKGWGAFPGAKYLGKKHGTSKVAVKGQGDEEDEEYREDDEDDYFSDSEEEHGDHETHSPPMPMPMHNMQR